MKFNRPIHYYVEGECEKKLIDALKGEKNGLLAGKVEVFNFVRDRFSELRIRTLKSKSIIILVYDIDVPMTSVLKQNIEMLTKHGFSSIHHIQSIKNFEDEIVFSTSLRRINDCFNTYSVNEFKSEFIAHKNILVKLKELEFDSEKLWSRRNTLKPFSLYSSEESLKFIHIS